MASVTQHGFVVPNKNLERYWKLVHRPDHKYQVTPNPCFFQCPLTDPNTFTIGIGRILPL